jgi:uracil-DNA glycosylase family 4
VEHLAGICAEVVECRRCPRLVAWREQVAHEKRAAYRHETYWGRPVPGFGDPQASILVLGLAPAAHGANRTGRVFTGDRSGEWFFRSMYRAGLASQPTATHRDDGLTLVDTWVTAAVKCAPPANRPDGEEQERCRRFLRREIAALHAGGGGLRVVLCLGALAFRAACDEFGIRPRPAFGHGVEVTADDGPTLVCSYHPSQQNTFTGRLTEQMLDAACARAAELATE